MFQNTEKKERRGEQTGIPGQAKTIGVITQLCHSSFMIEVNRGISEISAKLEKQGIRVCVKESATVDEAEQLAAIDELEREGIDAPGADAGGQRRHTAPSEPSCQ